MSDAKKILQSIEKDSKPAKSFKNFEFQEKEMIGSVCSVHHSAIAVKANSMDNLKDCKVGRLTAIRISAQDWLIMIFDTIDKDKMTASGTIIGSFYKPSFKNAMIFVRTVISEAEIEQQVYLIEGPNLSLFMGNLSETRKASDLCFGKFVIDPSIDAYVDGNSLYNRHAALLGSTGSGKSWTNATIIEQVSNLPNANMVIFDMHGEYKGLSYTRELRIAGPGDLETEDPNILFVPLWMLTFEELDLFLVDRTDPDSPTHSLMLSKLIRKGKRTWLQEHGKTEILESFTIDSPVPFDWDKILYDLKYMNTELIPGVKQGAIVKGPYYGSFDRLIPKIEARMEDKRYGFLFTGKAFKEYEYVERFVDTLMSTQKDGNAKKNWGIKLLDLSNVPSDILPVVVGLMARLLFSVQLWNKHENRHPIVLACDEAHLYLPRDENCNLLQRNAVHQFGRIAKEGRKYGITLMVISQRPSDVNTGVLSQCNSIITLRLTNVNDQEVVKKMMPDSMGGLIEQLPLLGIGELIAIGDCVVLPMRIKVNPPVLPPISETIQNCTEWAKTVDKNFSLKHGVENMRMQKRKY